MSFIRSLALIDSGVTLANQITIGRFLLVPVFAVLALAYGFSVEAGLSNESWRWWALGVFVAAAASDGLDGWIARRFNQRSELGAFLDPLADKALLLTGVVVLSLVDWGKAGWHLPVWFAVLVVARDAIILGGIRILRARQRQVKIAPHWTGKACTVTQMFALGWVMLRMVNLPPEWPCAVAALFTVWSGIVYVKRGARILRAGPAD